MRRVIAGVLLALVIAGVGAAVVYHRWHQPLQISAAGHRLIVARGDSLSGIAQQLARDGVLRDPLLLSAYARWYGLDQSMKRGEYLLPPHVTPRSLLQMLHRGEVVQYQLTLPEGITLSSAIHLLHSDSVLASSLGGSDDPRISALIAPHSSPEGLFLPETYRFERGDTDWDVLQRAYHAMAFVLADEWPRRSVGSPLETPYEALILASIIERETGLAAERAEIAGVFVRRLRLGMRLQTDPTVIYGLAENFDGNLTRTHLLDVANPYNTYRHRGLPPTPIALPGLAAIQAALHPRDGNSLYFVARGDGSHEFNATLAAHQLAVRKYQLQRVKQYRSSPGNH